MKVSTFLAFLFILPSWAFATDKLTNMVQAELLVGVSGVKPGDTFELGVLFKIDPGWHIYWKNPGDSGLPTSITFNLPDGFATGKLNWPIPIKFTRPGNIVDFGYEDSLLLWTVVEAPHELNEDSAIPVHAEVSWLSCQEVCIPGQAKVELILPVAESAEIENSKLFSEWEKRLAVDFGPDTNPFVWRVERGMDDKKSSAYTIFIDWDFIPGQVEWFPSPDSALEIDSTLLATEAKQTRITFNAKILTGQKLFLEVLESVVAYTDQEGKRKGINLVMRLNE